VRFARAARGYISNHVEELAMLCRNGSLLVLLALMLGCGKEEPPAPKSKAPEDLTNVPADFTMTAKDYYKDSHKDEKSSNKYDRKVVEISGEVSQAYGGHIRGVPFFKLVADASSWYYVHCDTVDPQPWAKIVPGQQIKVKGRQGISLENCVIVDYGKDPSITTSPEELAKEYQADPEATTKKYQDKYLRLEGDVVSLTLGQGGEIGRAPDKLVLKGNGAVRIECWFIGDFRGKEPENVQGRARLKVVGRFKEDADKSKVTLENCHAILP
jgi:hypothetical protein